MMFCYSEPCRISRRKGQRNLLWQDCRLFRLRRDVSRTNWIVRKLALAWILKSHILHVPTTVCTGNIDLVIENNFGMCISWYFVFQCLQNWNQSDNVRLKDCFHPQYHFFWVSRKRKYGPILNLIVITKGLLHANYDVPNQAKIYVVDVTLLVLNDEFIRFSFDQFSRGVRLMCIIHNS